MKVHIVPNLRKDPKAEVAKMAAMELLKHNVTVLFADDIFEEIGESFCAQYEKISVLAKQECYEMADVVVTIGGDGTILHEAILFLEYQKPILGVNLGRCGFLATCEKNELSEKLERLAKKDYIFDERALLRVSIKGKQWQTYALNDAVISKGVFQQTIDLDITCDKIPVERYRGDGVIVATPTGSTAYSLAAGGPVVDVRAKAMVLTPVCSHTLHVPSIVFAAKRKLSIEVGHINNQEIHLSCDGRSNTVLQDGDIVEVYVSQKKVSLVTFDKGDQFRAIDNKLRHRK